ncbi:MAG: succinate dehydrogenase cytochrome b subunit [Silvanigrellales bacterium]|jgi:succinate dehydrogenase / fumarate reductase cytochrome b subunit|nr:succinate dehydrogenase cytochrome b subunit [Silvanigrellales bacterium]
MSAAAGTLKYLTSSVGRKYIMAVTGLLWSGFVLSHMLGNLLIFVSAESYNRYAHALISNPLIYVAEAALVVTLALHAYNGISLWLRNQRTKPSQYAVAPTRVKGASLASKSMAYSGSIVLVFIILHLVTFKYGANYTAVYGGVEMRDLHRLVLEVFRVPAYVAWYFVCMVLVGVHLFHGFSSSFQTLGLNHPRYNGLLKAAGTFYGVVVAAGFIVQPLYVFFFAR